MTKFYVGETVPCAIRIKDSNGNLKDPDTSINIKIDLMKPFTNVLSDTGMSKSSTGKYSYNYNSSSNTPGAYEITYTATDGSIVRMHKKGFTLE